jgi:hypothetical protein
MILTKNNLQEWKTKLNNLMFKRYQIVGFAEGANSDEQWLEDYLGYDVEDAIDGEVECWEE